MPDVYKQIRIHVTRGLYCQQVIAFNIRNKMKYNRINFYTQENHKKTNKSLLIYWIFWLDYDESDETEALDEEDAMLIQDLLEGIAFFFL